MKTWDDWSDLEVSAKVAEVIGLNFEIISETLIVAVKHSGDNVTSITGAVDYCNNWADMGPIIDKHGIRLHSVACPAGSGLVFLATDIDNSHDSGWQPSYCRAAAIVFLMMNGVTS